jgi:hypothetical protein
MQIVLREIGLLRSLMDVRMQGMTQIEDEKFARVERQLQLVELQRVEQKQDTKAAVDAALAAQKEAARDQTLASDKAIEKSEATFAAAIGAVNTAVNDLKERVTKIEARAVGGRAAYGDLFLVMGIVIAGIGLVVGFVR